MTNTTKNNNLAGKFTLVEQNTKNVRGLGNRTSEREAWEEIGYKTI